MAEGEEVMEDGIWRDSWEQATLTAKEQIIIKVFYLLERKKETFEKGLYI